MTMTYRINIQLSEQEFEALRAVSQVQLRHPRDQARHILRSVLLDESISEPSQPPVKIAGKLPQNAGATVLVPIR